MHSQSLTRQTLSGILWQSASAGANLVLRAIVLIILARHLTAAEFGIVAAALVVASICQALAETGTAKALVQRLTLTEEHVKAGFAFSLYAGVAGAALLLIGAPLFAASTGVPGAEPVVRLFSVLVLLNCVAAVPTALLHRQRKFKRASAIDLVAFGLGYGAVGVALTFAGYGFWALAVAQVSQTTLRTALYLFASRPAVGVWPQWVALRELFRTGSGYSAGKFGNLLATQVDYLIVGRTLGVEALGLYNRAYQLFMLPAQLVGTASQTVLFPSIAAIQDQPERVARAYLRAVGVIAMATLPMSGVLFVVAPELVDVTLGPRWHGMVLPFQLLVATLMFRTSYKISDSLALAMGAMKQRAARQWLYAGAVAAGAALGARMGLAGVAFGVSLAVVLSFLLMLQLACRLTGLRASTLFWLHARHALTSIPIVIATAVAVLAARSGDYSTAIVLIAGCASAAAAAALMWWRCRWVFGDDGEWAHSHVVTRLPLLRARGAD